ncbi:type II secretion system F family protein [Bacillus salitolerans]|uniref:Type II secretion system F family protein n=1 Tax=Bacillus salitolerans TaxID=1437434 RepID=A0ABW4LKI2_9BACI
MLFFTFFLTITFIVYAILVFQHERKERVKRRISLVFDRNSNSESSYEDPPNAEVTPSLFQRMLKPIWREFKKGFKKKIPGEKEAKIEIKLLQAGNPFGMTPVEYRLVQIAIFILFPFLAIGYGVLLGFGTGGLTFMVFTSLAASWVLPNMYLRQKIKKRYQLAVRELPDVLDLLTVSLEAGLGFDSALSKLVSKKEGVLASEFHRCLEEIRLGKTRREALSGIRERLAVDEIKVLISSIIQAEKLGIGMVQVLRIQSAEVRDQRKQRAEEEAMKAPIKMLFPLVLFIFPSLFIVLLGPAIIQFLQTFKQ